MGCDPSIRILGSNINSQLSLYMRKFELVVSANDKINSLHLSHV